ncbi:MAG: UvrD-helicase domain-containing protein [Holosporaceae bacterium]|jgi:ATP-dependent helicase/nuclease subunit A|nr:UvrD-helicase domain-containing protein [Holosporaceae bacterium]
MLKETNDISASMWISASAGTGKTKSLIDRIIALLLNNVKPSKILCLTYTNAAASEMLARLSDYLLRFKQISENDLKIELSNIGFEESLMGTAKKLYDRSINEEWVSIQTIHSFCFDLIKKFPMETGLFPGIKLCDNYYQQQLIRESIKEVLSDEKYESSWQIISEYTTDISDFVINYTMDVKRFVDKIGNFKQHYADFFNVDSHIMDQDDKKIDEILIPSLLGKNYREIFSELAQILFNGGASDRKSAKILQENAIDLTEELIEVFITERGTIRARLCSNAISDPGFLDHIKNVAVKILEFWNLKKRYISGKVNIAFFEIIEKILDKFQKKKIANHLLDFNDLILFSLSLLENIDLVKYKTNGGADHILIDEAQDTSPEQWEVIKAITGDLSSKTIFVVGDEKQSIYSFQGADIKFFSKVHSYFEKNAYYSGKKIHNLELSKSYRTTGNILSFVDEVFSEKFHKVRHSTVRNSESGVVEIIDLFEDDSEMLQDQNTSNKTSDYIASFIKKMIVEKVLVESRNRAAQPSDFLILFQHRNMQVMKSIVRALKEINIPVSGVDRVLLKDELIVEDLISLAEFAIFPLDDLMCARVLKSPIVGITESDLQKICLDRGNNHLWDYLKSIDWPFGKLEDYVDKALKLSAYDFFIYVLNNGAKEKFIGRLGEKCLDPLYEFLELALEHDTSLQLFIEWFHSFEHEIKRDSSSHENAVKLMTVHASKGLQSPFIILADSHFVKNKNKKILRTEEGNLFWDFSENYRTEAITKMYSVQKQADYEEFYRLLYVAMTRAEDFLCILGEKHKKALDEKSWYKSILQKNSKFERVDSDNLYRLGSYTHMAAKKQFSEEAVPCSDIPAWFYEKIPLPTVKIDQIKTPQMVYGDCVHALLNEMPIYMDCYDKIANQLLENFDLTQAEKENAKAEAYSVLKKFDFLFDSNALSEVSFAYDGKELRPDKVAFLNVLWIVDFKTGNPKEIIPSEYVFQLKLYQEAVQKILKPKQIKTAILWTQNQNLVEIA